MKRALLIGINHYKAVPGLQGSINDVQTMRQILLTRWGFPAANITMLTDEAATRAGILAALNKLVNEAGPEDIVYVHYSGHGSQVQDLNGDEDDGLDETIVPQDGRSAGVRDIIDDELDEIFSHLKTPHAVIVLDSCHSGTAMRSLDFRTRSVPQDKRIELYQAAEKEAGPRKRGIVPRVQSRFLVLSGAADNQEAIDGPIEGRAHGFFTYALSRSVSSLGPDASVRQVFSGVQHALDQLQAQFGRVSMPEPQLDAPPELIEEPLFGRSVADEAMPTGRVASVVAEPKSPTEIRLVNGVLQGASLRSSWSIYPPGETRFAAGNALAVATVRSVAGDDAIAKLLPSGKPVLAHARAVLFMPAPAAQDVAIRIGELQAPRRRAVDEALKSTAGNVSVVGNDATARFTIDESGDSVRLLSADGQQVLGTFDTQAEQWAAALGRAVSRQVKAAELLGFDNPQSQLQVSVNAGGHIALQGRSIIRVAAGTATYHIRHRGEPRSTDNSLQLEVTTSADAYLTIVDVDSEGGLNLLFPNDRQKKDFLADGHVSADQVVSIPDSLAPGNRAGFYWDYSPPAGLDTIRVFASADLNTARLIRERIKAAQGTPVHTRGLGTGDSADEGLDALRSDLTHVVMRGISVVGDEPEAAGAATASAPAAGDWAATNLSITIAN